VRQFANDGTTWRLIWDKFATRVRNLAQTGAAL